MKSKYLLLFVLGALCFHTAQGANKGEPSGGLVEVITSSGDVVIVNPIESGVVFLGVILVSAMLEFGLDKAGDVENKYFHVMFEAVSEEILVVGILALMIKFGQTIIDMLPSRYFIIFEWAHMCLFFMAMTFVIIILLVLLVTGFNNKKWAEFEAKRLDQDDGTLSAREKEYKHSHHKFLLTLQAYGFRSDQGILFDVYLLKMERRNLVELTDLTWKSWMSLSTLVMLNAFRTRMTPTQGEDETTGQKKLNDQDRLINYVTYILFCGYGTLFVFGLIHHTLQNRLSQFLHAKLEQGNQSDMSTGLLNKDDLEDPQTFLPWQNKENTLELLQMIIMFFEWYLSVFVLSFSWSVWKYIPEYAIVIYAAAVVPFIIFLMFFPWTLTTVTILSSLGASLNEGVVRDLVRKVQEARDAKNPKAGGDGHGHGGHHDGGHGGGHGGHESDHHEPLHKTRSIRMPTDDAEGDNLKYFLRKKRFPHRDKLAEKLAVIRGHSSLDDPWPSGELSPTSPGGPNPFKGAPGRGGPHNRSVSRIGMPHGSPAPSPMTYGRYNPPSIEMSEHH